MSDVPPFWANEVVWGSAAALLTAVAALAVRRAFTTQRDALEIAQRRAAKEHERAEVLEKSMKAERERGGNDPRSPRAMLDGLSRSVRELAACASRDDVATALGRGAAMALEPRRWMVFLAVDDDGKEFVVAASGSEDGTGVWKPGARLTAQTGRVGLAVRRRSVMDRGDFEAEPPIVREQVARTEPQDFRIDVVVPVLVGDRVVAAIAVGDPDTHMTTARSSLEILAQFATVVLRGIAAKDRAERLANHDTLTGVGNRSWFNAAAAEEMYRRRQQGGSGALVLFGIDDFPHYVRRNGHAAGDRLVKGVANVLRPLVAETDLLARWGGDEFVVFVPGADARTAWELAARARKAASAVDWPFSKEQPRKRITLCAAIATFPGTGSSLESLIEAAARTLAEAQASGGDTTGSIRIEPLAAANAPAKPPAVAVSDTTPAGATTASAATPTTAEPAGADTPAPASAAPESVPAMPATTSAPSPTSPAEPVAAK